MIRTLTSKNPPLILYKYRTWSNDHHKRLIQNQELYFPKPSSFNDPFDGNIPVRWDLLTDEEIFHKNLEMVRIFHKNESHEVHQQLAKRITNEKTLWNRDNAQKESEESIQHWDGLIGLFSLTEKRDNILMWSHYSNFHKGFVVGFNTESLIQEYDFDYLNKIRYQEKYPLISGNDSIEDRFQSKFFTKSSNWAYEEEWRISKNHIKNRTFQLNLNTYAEIVLGCEMQENDKQAILTAIKENFGDSVKVLQAIKSEDSFSLNFATL